MAKRTLAVKHNIEVAHRLSQLPGKCQNIHGHSMLVTVELEGEVDQKGILLGLDFSQFKRAFRGYLDSQYDHHLLLNEHDQFAQPLYAAQHYNMTTTLPGLITTVGDPTTENIAMWIGDWAKVAFGCYGLHRVRCEVWETAANMATWEAVLEPEVDLTKPLSAAAWPGRGGF